MKFSVKYFFSKCDLTRSFRRISSHLLKKSLTENLDFCAVQHTKFRNAYSSYLPDVDLNPDKEFFNFESLSRLNSGAENEIDI